MNRFKVCLISLVLAVFSLMATPSVANHEFCWKDSFGRGVGTIPTNCGPGKQYDAGLCYNNCREGYSGVGPVCWSSCPSGYTDFGATCHINKPLTTSPTITGCHLRIAGHCIIPKTDCPSGYINIGLFCALESAGKSPPPGFSGTFLDPMKNSYGRGVGTIPTACSGGKQYDAGLCYTPCAAGYTGVGPVCWGNAPSGWVNCGMGAAKDSSTCGQVVFGQVASVGNLALTLATVGASTAGTGAAGAAQDSERLTRLRTEYERLKNLYEANKKRIDAIILAKKAAGATISSVQMASSDTVTEEDIVRISAQIAAIADPTGASDTVAAYTYPKCSRYFSGSGGSATPPPTLGQSRQTIPAFKRYFETAIQGWAPGPFVPSNAVIGGQDHQKRNLPICHAQGKNGEGVLPGYVMNKMCIIGVPGHGGALNLKGGDKAVRFNIMTPREGKLVWIPGSIGSKLPANAVIGGHDELENPYYICRATLEGGVYIGNIDQGRCWIGMGNTSTSVSKFEILTQQ